VHGGRDLFVGLPDPMQVMRYHSLIVDAGSLPPELMVLAHAADDPSEIHAVRHREHPVWGVQFHPESIMTPDGKQLLRNFIELAL
jgi:anthranilate synthase component II